MKVRRHAWISGRVQGVSFRFYTRDLAASLGVSGWVRNLPDGRVELLAEGEESAVEQVMDFCRKGPPGAHVVEVEVKNENFLNEFTEFKVQY